MTIAIKVKDTEFAAKRWVFKKDPNFRIRRNLLGIIDNVCVETGGNAKDGFFYTSSAYPDNCALVYCHETSDEVLSAAKDEDVNADTPRYHLWSAFRYSLFQSLKATQENLINENPDRQTHLMRPVLSAHIEFKMGQNLSGHTHSYISSMKLFPYDVSGAEFKHEDGYIVFSDLVDDKELEQFAGDLCRWFGDYISRSESEFEDEKLLGN